jgi:hypothetical protein
VTEYQYVLDEIGERRVYGRTPPVGRLIAHEDRVYRVIDVLVGSGQIFLQPFGGTTAEGISIYGEDHQAWRVLPEHHAVCARCGEPMPCRDLREQSKATHALRRARRLMSIPEGACWYCEEPISSRQKSVTFPGDNLNLPGGPPAMFHTGIQDCRHGAMTYQEEWVKAEAGREPFLGWYDPYTGKPNTTQRRLLAMAARGELGCHLTRVQVAKAGDDLLDMMTNPDRMDAKHVWYPDRLPRGAEEYIHPLIDAGLLAEPIPQHLGYQKGVYVLTDEGWATHRRYPEKREAA